MFYKMIIASLILSSSSAFAATPEELTQASTTVATCQAFYNGSLMYYSFAFGAMAALGDTSATKEAGQMADDIVSNQKTIREYKEQVMFPSMKQQNMDLDKAKSLYDNTVKEKTNLLVDEMINSVNDGKGQLRVGGILMRGMKTCTGVLRDLLGIPPQQKPKKTTEI